MRHRLSSLFASLDMKASDKKILEDQIGMMRINKENYQCPPGVQSLRVMGKMLTDADNVARSSGDLSGSEESDREKIVKHAITQRKIANTDNFSEYLSSGGLPDSESEDEVIGGKNTEKCAVIRRKNARIKNVPGKNVKCSETDTGVVRHTFRSYVYTETDKQNCKGSLPSKEEILRFIKENHLELLNNLTQKEKYLKTRAKIFNERKTVTEETCMAMKIMALKKNTGQKFI